MKIRCLSLVFSVSSLWAQTPAAPAEAAKEAIKPDTVIAVVNGKPYTAEAIDKLLAPVSPVQRQAYLREPQTFLEQYAMYDLIGQMAEKEKVDQKSPYKEQLAEMRRQFLVQAYVNEYKNAIPILPAQQKAYYDANLDKYKESKIKVVFIPFSNAPAADGKKLRTEAEAKAKAETVVNLARSGVDFVKLVKEHSEDPGTAGNDGNFGIGIRAGASNVPENLKTAVLALKQADVTDPIRQSSGFVVAKVESVSAAPYDSVKDEIFKEMKDAEVRKLVDETKKKATVKIENNAYFQQQAGTGK